MSANSGHAIILILVKPNVETLWLDASQLKWLTWVANHWEVSTKGVVTRYVYWNWVQDRLQYHYFMCEKVEAIGLKNLYNSFDIARLLKKSCETKLINKDVTTKLIG